MSLILDLKSHGPVVATTEGVLDLCPAALCCHTLSHTHTQGTQNVMSVKKKKKKTTDWTKSGRVTETNMILNNIKIRLMLTCSV